MKAIIKISTIFVLLMVIYIKINAQSSEYSGWKPLFCFNISNICNSNNIVASNYSNSYITCSENNSSVLHEINDRTYLGQRQIPGLINTVSFSHMTYWGNDNFYVSNNSDTIYTVDLFNNSIINSTVIQDTNIIVRNIAYDLVREAMWVCDLSTDLYLIDMNSGITIDTIQVNSLLLNNKVGLAYTEIPGDLAILDTTDGAKIHFFHINNNEITFTLDLSNDYGLSNITASSIECAFNSGNPSLSGILHQGETDFFFLYEADVVALFDLYSPPNFSNSITIAPFFNWHDQENNLYYTLQISTDIEFNNVIFNVTNLAESEYSLSDSNKLNYNSTYYWRVGGFNLNNELEWTSIWSFTTEAAPISNISIPLQYGWNMVSSNVIPTEPAMESVFEVMNNIVLVKNDIGQIYSPVFGINEIGDWNIGAGYYVYTNAGSILNISGSEVIPSQQGIELNAGWNLVSYLRNSPMNAQQALAGISSNLILAKNNSGGFYHPGFGINTLGDMQPGQGYWLYMNEPTVLYYPGND